MSAPGDPDRFALLAAVAQVADGRMTLEDTAGRVCELVVPGFADISVLDVVHEAGPRRLAVKAAGTDAAELERRLLHQPPSEIEASVIGAAMGSGEPQLLDARGSGAAASDAVENAERELLRASRAATGIVIPLGARGRTIGALTLLLSEASGNSYNDSDVVFFAVFGGRVALALDNAGLFNELRTMEAQLSAALGALGEAVTIQNVHGNLIYANQAAAEMMGAASPAAVLAAPADELVGRYDYYDEDGAPLDPSGFPGRQLLAGNEPRPLVMRVVDRGTGEQRWRRATASAVHDSSGRLTMVVNVVADITLVKRAELSQRLLARAGELLNSTLELEETLEQLANLCVPELADWCTVRLAEPEHRRLDTVAVAHGNPERVRLVQDSGERYPVGFDDEGGLAQVYRSGQPVTINGITDEMLVRTARDAAHLELMRGLAPHATLIMPMKSQQSTVGVLTLVQAESARNFDPQDVALVSELARRAGTAVENARIYTERSSIATTLQDSLLPEALPALPGWRTARLYRPAGREDRVGGDFFDAIPLGQGAWMVLVGDVTGRGAAAASLTAMMRHTLRAIATFTGSAATALEKLNRDLVARPQLTLCTVVCAVLQEDAPGTARADIYCAGHPRPLLVGHGTGRYVGEFGPILGADPDARFEPTTVTVEPGEVLVLYSDGITDTVGNEDRFGPQRLLETVGAATSAQEAVANVEAALAEYQVGLAADDAALLAIERTTRSQ